jgi:hypothetical protein
VTALVAVAAVSACGWGAGSAGQLVGGTGGTADAATLADADVSGATSAASGSGSCDLLAGLSADAGVDTAPDAAAPDAGANGLPDGTAQSCPGQQQLSGYLTPSSVEATLVRPVPDDTILHVDVGLPLRNDAAMQRVVDEVSDPGSPCYRQYLTGEQLSTYFDPTVEDYDTLIDWAESKGLTVVGTYSNRLLLDLSGTAAAVERAFCVNLNYFELASGNQFYAPDREPSLDLSIPVTGITNLNSVANALPPAP